MTVTESEDNKRQAYIMWLIAGALTLRAGGEVTITGEELYECSLREAVIELQGDVYCIKLGPVRK